MGAYIVGRRDTDMAQTAPGKHHRQGLTIIELMEMFPTEDEAQKWFEDKIWPNGRHCPRCGNVDTVECGEGHPMPYRCHACNRYFSVRVGTLLERSKVPLRKWAIAIYFHLTNLKGVSSMKLHRDLGITQKTAWFMLQRIREAFDSDDDWPFGGPVEADETYVGGRRKNMSKSKRKELAKEGAGRGAVGKVAIAGVKDRETKQVRAKVVTSTDAPTLQGFVRQNTAIGATIYTDEATAYQGLGGLFYTHETVCHSVSEYVRGQAHTNGAESFWSMLKRGYQGVYHKMSPKHLNRYVQEFAGRHGLRDSDTVTQMGSVVSAMSGKRLTYAALIADNGLESGARGWT